MLPSEIEFSTTIEAIRAYASFLATLDIALAAGARVPDPSEDVREADALLAALAKGAAQTTPRRFAHTVLVIEVYGAIEQLVEGLLRDYLTRVQLIHPRLADLPSRLLKTHERKSAELLLAADRLPVQISSRDVIANLHACHQQTTPYKLNADAFTLRTANMRTGQIRQMFGEVGIENVTRRAHDGPLFQRYLARRHGRRSRPDDCEFPELDELVSYRNEAAHGRPSSVLSPQLLADGVDFAEALGAALARAVDEASVESAVLRTPALGVLKGVFRSRIVCVELATPVSVGDSIAGRTPDGRCRFGAISRMEVNHAPVTTAVPGDVVGMEVGFHAKANQQFYKLPW